MTTPLIPDRSHRLIEFCSSRPHLCDHCSDYIWGIGKIGLVCQNCNAMFHPRCASFLEHYNALVCQRTPLRALSPDDLLPKELSEWTLDEVLEWMAAVSIYRYIELFRNFQRKHTYASSNAPSTQSVPEGYPIDGLRLAALNEAALEELIADPFHRQMILKAISCLLREERVPAVELRGSDAPAQPLPPPSARHQFLEHSWTSLEECVCDVCGRTLFGLTRQGLRCRVCGLRAHRACEHSGASLPLHRCRPPPPATSALAASPACAFPNVSTSAGVGLTPASSMDSGVEGAGFAFEPTSVFEQELEEQFDASTEEAPLLLVWCCSELEARFASDAKAELSVIYRRTPETRHIVALRAAIDDHYARLKEQRARSAEEGVRVGTSAPAAGTNGATGNGKLTQPDLSRFTPNVLAAAIKKYLRDLPNPLLPTELYDQFVAATQLENHEARVNAVKGLRGELGHVRLRTLRFLMRHLVRLIRMQHERKTASASATSPTPAGAGNLTPTLAHRVPKTSTSSNYDALAATSTTATAGGAGGAGAALPGAMDVSPSQDLIGRLDPVVASVLIRPPWHSHVRAMVYNSLVHTNLADLLMRDLDWGEQLPPELHRDGSRSSRADPTSLDQVDWYWGSVDKETVNAVMRDLPDGSFLVRDSLSQSAGTDKEYTLTLRHNGSNKLIKIYSREDHFWFNEALQFRSMPDLVQYFTLHSLTEYSGALDAKLVYPVSKQTLCAALSPFEAAADLRTLEKMLLQANIEFMNKSTFREALQKRIIEWEQGADYLKNAAAGLVEVRKMYDQALAESRRHGDAATTGELASVYRRNNVDLEARILTLEKNRAETEQQLELLTSRIEQAAEGHKAVSRELKQLAKQRDRYKNLLLMRAHEMKTTLTAIDVDAKLEMALQRLQSAGQQVALDETRAEEQVQGVYESGPFPGAADCGAHIPMAYSVENLALDEALGYGLEQRLESPENNNMASSETTPTDQSGVGPVDAVEGQNADYVSHAPTAEQQMPPHLERRLWFTEKCENANAAVQLLANHPDGTFLIRPSTNFPNAPYTLSVVANRKVSHARIFYAQGEGYYFGDPTTDPNIMKFQSLDELVLYFHQRNLSSLYKAPAVCLSFPIGPTN